MPGETRSGPFTFSWVPWLFSFSGHFLCHLKFNRQRHKIGNSFLLDWLGYDRGMVDLGPWTKVAPTGKEKITTGGRHLSTVGVTGNRPGLPLPLARVFFFPVC